MAHRVLILDDDLHAGRLIAQALAPMGVEAEAFQSARSALAAFKASPSGLVVIDLLLPEGDGAKIAEEFRKAAPSLPLVFVSAVYRKPQVARDIQVRFGAPLVLKPFDLVDIRRAIAQGLGIPFEEPQARREDSGPKKAPVAPPAAAIGPMAGSLSRKPLYALLGEMYRGRATGLLELTREPLKKRIYLEMGFVRFATSNVRAESVGGVLLAEGRLSMEQFQLALEAAKSKQIQLHEALVSVGALSPSQVQPALKQQTAEVVVAGCGLPDGSFSFQAIKELSVPEARQHPIALALSGVRRFYPLPAIREYLQQRAGMPLHKSADLDRERYTIQQVFPNEQVTPLVNGKTMVLEAVEKIPEGELPLLFGLIGMGLVGFAPFGSSTSITRTSGPSSAGPVESKVTPGIRNSAGPGGAMLGATPGPAAATPGPARVGIAAGTPGPAGAQVPPGSTPGRGVLVSPSPGATRGALDLPDPAAFAHVDPVTDATRLSILTEYQRIAGMDHYGALGVDRKAAGADIKKAYIAAAKRWHSDSFAGVDLGPVEPYLQAVFSAVGEAHRVLTDEKSRSEYDVLLYRQERGLPTDVSKILEAEELFGKAQHLYRSNRIQEAEGLLRRAVELNHAEGEFWSYLAICGYRLRGGAAAAEARASFARARELAPGSQVTDLFEGMLESGEGNLDAAERLIKRFMVEQPDNVDAQRELRLVREKREKSRGVIDKILNRK